MKLSMMEIRPARGEDAAAVDLLLTQLGYELPADTLLNRLSKLGNGDTDRVLVAEDAGRIVGLMALHWTVMLHAALPVARITTLVVDDAVRGKGVGRRLVNTAADLARQAGCGVLELTTGLQRTDAQAFYQAIGFTASSMRLHRPLTT